MLSGRSSLLSLQKGSSIGLRLVQTRCLHADSLSFPRNRLSKLWAPDTRPLFQSDEIVPDGHSLLLRGAFLRQSHAGIFHLLPLGLRVQNKLEELIDRHMTNIGASKVLLSSISSEKLWTKSGRIDGPLKDGKHELFAIEDRRKSGFLLSPTHEEEISTMVRPFIDSYKKLPIRLYQVSRKYRDELRPRQGLLRSKEFVMKDLYTFDSSVEAALDTYQQVRAAYNGLFTELGIPFLTAEADSGGMGGKLSHEYHLESPLGEDIVWNCDKCNYAANDEVVEARQCDSATESWRAIKTWRSISKDRSRHIVVVYPAQYQATEAAVEDLDQKILKEVYPDIDFSIDCPDTLDTTPANQTKSVTFIFDPRISAEEYFVSKTPTGQNTVTIVRADCRLTAIQSGDLCPRCPNGHLTPHRTIEVGHTFHLGTRYSEPLDVTAMPATPGEPPVPVQMGCHGIGVSRLIGAMASILASPTGQRMPAFGLRWPLAIAPYHVLVISLDQNLNPVAEEVYDCLANLSSVATQGKIDVLLDDRDKPVASRLYEADLVGYPIVTIVGRAWTRSKKVEVYCRKTGQRKEVMLHELERIVRVMLSESELGLD